MSRLICIRRINQTALSFFKVIDMPEHNPGQMGGTMRLGLRKTLFKTNHSLMSKFHISGLLTFSYHSEQGLSTLSTAYTN